MQLGMVGLGRMGANMVRRLLKGGHQCVVFDMSPKAVNDLVQEKAAGSSSLQDLVAKLQKPRADLVDGASGRRGSDHRRAFCPISKPDDILIDGGNSYYMDDIRRAKELRAEGHSLRGCRNQRRRLGPGARLLHDDRRRERRRSSTSIRSSPRSPRAQATSPRTPDARSSTAPPNRAICTAAQTAPATSSRWCTTESSTASWPPTPKGWASCTTPTSAKQNARGRCGDHAAARPRALPVRSEPARHLRSLASRQRDRLVAAGPDRRQPGEGSRALAIRRARLRFRRGPMDDQGGHRRSRAGARAFQPRSTNASVRAVRRITRTGCCRPCASDSAVTWRNAGK